MNDNAYRRLLEQSWRGKLSSADQQELRAWLEAHPEARTDWEAETALSRVIATLPNVPVSSNFTARVLDAVRQEPVKMRRPSVIWAGWIGSLLPRSAIAAVLLLMAAGFAYQKHATLRRTQLAQSVAAVSEVTSLPSPEILQDFEAIRQLSPTPAADNELLALMQ